MNGSAQSSTGRNQDKLTLHRRPLQHNIDGQDTDDMPIVVNGGTLVITRNLRAFLQVLLESDQSENWFWADQVSVNQDDVCERGHQVQLMGEIYSEACQVFSWLGEQMDDSLMLHLSASVYAGIHRLNDQRLADLSQALRNICQRSYWGRVWILQEVRLARKLTLWCGQFPLPPQLLFNLIREARTALRADRFPIEKSRELVRAYVQLGEAFTSDQSAPWNLEWAINRVVNLQCADMRDRIFGIQALIMENQRVEINYTLSINELLSDVVEVILNNHVGIDMTKGCHTLFVGARPRPCWETTTCNADDLGLPWLRNVLSGLAEESKQREEDPGSCELQYSTLWSFMVRQIIRDYSKRSGMNTKPEWSRVWRRIKRHTCTPHQRLLGAALEARKADFTGSISDLIQNAATSVGFIVDRFFVYHPGEWLPPKTMWPLDWYKQPRRET